MLTGKEMAKLLRAIEASALVPYPFPSDAPRPGAEASLILALGLIAGTARKALDDYRKLGGDVEDHTRIDR